jgi:hypothetical protein
MILGGVVTCVLYDLCPKLHIVGGTGMADGERYSNGVLDGFLRSRAATAFLNGRESENIAASMEWLRAGVAFQEALESYEQNGDSEEVKRLTGEGMDYADKAAALERQS